MIIMTMMIHEPRAVQVVTASGQKREIAVACGAND
jgi:hypothetical protein